MSPENQNFGQVESGQKRLETVRASADSPQALKQKLQDYRATYQTEVNRQKSALTNFVSTFDSSSAKGFVMESAGKLGSKMVELAQEGESLQRASIKNKQDKGEPLTEKELNFQTLASLKATLQTEMGRQRVELGNLRKLHQLDAEYSRAMKADNKANERVTVTGIPAAITAKASQYETLARVIQDLSALPASPTYDEDRTALIRQIGLFRASLALDQQSGQTFLVVQEKAALQKADLTKLKTKISGKKPLTREEYQSLNNELQQAFSNVGNTEAKINEVMGRGSFLKNLDYETFKASNLTPLWDNLLALRGQLEAKNPQRKDKDKTDETTEERESGKDLLLKAAEAREQLAIKKDQIRQVEQYLKRLKRDPRQNLNREEFVKLGKEIAELQGEVEGLQTKYQINKLATDEDNNTRLLFLRLQAADYQPTLVAAQALEELNLAREPEIKALENKLFNAEVEKLIPRLKASWATSIEGQKAYLETPPSYDEKDPNFKAYQEGERTLLTNLIACESQVNFVLSRQDSGMPEGNKLILERYRTLSQEYQTKIQSNRAHRHVLRAIREGAGQDQDHTYHEKVGTRRVGKGDNAFDEVILKEGKTTYKFNECVRFLDPNDPKYNEINGGKGWEFIKKDLPQDIQDRFAQNAGNIVTDSRREAENEMFRDRQKILTENKLFDRTREDLGAQAKDYFAAGEAMAAGDIPKALAAYNKYLELSKTFSPEDLDKHKNYLEDARRQVESVGNSAEFYEGMRLMKDGKLDAALPLLRTYIERIKKLPKEEQKTFAEQLNAATEIMRKINSTKMSMLVDLKNDLKYLSAIHTARNVGTKRDNVLAELKKLQQNSYAISRGEKPPFADSDIDLDPIRRDLLLPYIPYDQLTTEEKIKINKGGGGLTGPDVTDLEDSIKKLEKRIADGEPVDFEKEVTAIKEKMADNADPKKYPLAATYTGPDGQQRVDVPSARLFDMFNKINSTDPKEREKGFVYIADQFKSAEVGMQYTQKYLRKAMIYQYEQWEKDDGNKTKKEVMNKMLADKNIAADILKGAKEQYRRNAEEENAKNPGKEAAVPLDPPDPIILQRLQSQIFEQQFRFQYEREIRNKMTNLGMASPDSALERFNVSLPYENVDGSWYKPWNWSDCNEDQWNDVKTELAQFAVETIVTLPIGMGAGAIGRTVGSGVLKALARQGLKAEAIALIEKGGIMALRNSSRVWEGVSPALKQSIMASRGKIIASWGVGLAAEGTSMLLMNSIWEGLNTGRSPEIFRQLDAGEWKHVSLTLLESIGKAGVFRAMGAAQGQLMKGLGAGVESSATRNMLANMVGESASGFAGTGLEALTMLAKGQGDQITTDFWVRSMVQNALQSYGTHLTHGGLKKPQFLLDREQARYTAVDTSMDTQRLSRLGIQTASDIQSARLGTNGEYIINNSKAPASEIPFSVLPAEVQTRIREMDLSARKVEMKAELSSHGINKPADIQTVRDGKIITSSGEALPIPHIALLPPALRERYDALRAQEVQNRLQEIKPILILFERRTEVLKNPQEDPGQLPDIDARIAEHARERGVTVETLVRQINMENRILRGLDSVYQGEQQFYHESKIIRKPVLNDDGTPKLENGQPVYEMVNLFENYESKATAYSISMLHNINYENLVKAGGAKIIKLGGDELLVYHAGPDGTVQNMFIDISNMGPTNDTATNLASSKVNLVDVYLHQISDSILRQSKANIGKALDPTHFNAEVARIADSLFKRDLDADGRPLNDEDGAKAFQKLKDEWGLEGTYEQYRTDMGAMRILAEFRADTRYLDSSFKDRENQTFSEHIAGQIQHLTGMSVPDFHKMVTENPQAFKALIEARLPKSSKLQGMKIDEVMSLLTEMNPVTATPQTLMTMYSLFARLDTSTLAANPKFRALAENIQRARGEMVGDPPHPRVDQPRLMDAKVVTIDLPKDLATALANMAGTDPVKANAILAAARRFAEKPLDSLKYSKGGEFARFDIMEYVEIRNGTVVVKESAGDFQAEVTRNQQDKKLTNVVETEKSLEKVRDRMEELRTRFQENRLDERAYQREMQIIEREIGRLENLLRVDPDTGAFGQAYLDVKPTLMYSFSESSVPVQERVWNSAVTELAHSGVINAKYGYQAMDTIMANYFQALHQGISEALPPAIRHFKIIRSGGGKFEVIFLDRRAVDFLAQQGLTPDSLVQQIARQKGQPAVDAVLNADPKAFALAQTDAAVRNAQFRLNKGTKMVAVGQLTSRAESNVDNGTISRIYSENPEFSARRLISTAIEAQKAGKGGVDRKNEHAVPKNPESPQGPDPTSQDNVLDNYERPIAALAGDEPLSLTMRMALSDIEALDAYTKKESPYLPANDPEFRKLETTKEREAYLLTKLKEFRNQVLYERTDNATQLKINELAELLVGGTIKHGDQRLQITSNLTGVDGLPPDWQTRVVNRSKATYEADKTNILVLKSHNAGEPDSYLLINSEAVKEMDHSYAHPTADKNRAVFQLHNELRTTLGAITKTITDALREAQQSRSNQMRGAMGLESSPTPSISRPSAKARPQRSILNNSYSRSLLEFGRGLRTDPEIQKLPPDERRQVIAERIRAESERMRVDIQNKKQTISEISDLLFARRKADPTLSTEALKGIFEAQAKERQLSLTAEEKQYIDKVISEIAQKQTVVDDYFQRFKETPERLFVDVFGFQPTGKVELIQSDFSINFLLHAKEDVDKIYTRTAFKALAERTMGFSIPSSRVAELRGLINVVRGDAKQVYDIQTVITHEERHTLNRSLLPDNLIYNLAFATILKANSLQDLRQSYRNFLEFSLKQAQDEISAYQEQGFTPEGITEVLTTEGENYDYWASIKGKGNKLFLKNLIGKQRDGETIADYEQRKQRTELEVDSLYNEYRDLHNRRVQEMVAGAFETPHPVMNVLQTPTQLQRAGRQAQKRVEANSEARREKIISDYTSYLEQHNTPQTEGPPGPAIESFYRYSERYNKEILVYKQGDHWIDQNGHLAPPPSPEEINIAVSQKPQAQPTAQPTAQPKVVPHIEIMSGVERMVNNGANLEKIVAYIDQFNKASISDFPSGGIIQTSRYRISADNEGKLRMTIMFDSPRNRKTVDAAVDRIVAGDAIDPVLGLDRPKPLERPIPAAEAARLDQQTRDYILGELGGRDRFSDGTMYDFKPPIIESITPGQDLRKVYLSPSYEQMVPFLRELMGQVSEQGIGMRSAKFFSLAMSRDGAGNINGQGYSALCFYFAGDSNFFKFIEAVEAVEKRTGIKLLSFNNQEAPLAGKMHKNKILYGVDSTRPGDDGFTHGSLSHTMVERGQAARDASIARGESPEQVRAATRNAMNEAVMQARGVGLDQFLTLGENTNPSPRPDAEWTLAIREDLETHAKQLEQMGLTDCARELLDTNIKFSSVDGFALDTPQKRLAYYHHLADLARTNPELLQWYQSRPRPFDSKAIAGKQGEARQLAEQTAANDLKEFNSSFVSERIIPSLLDSPLKFWQQVQVLHEWLTRGTHAQTENMESHGYNLGGAFREGVGVRVIVGDNYRPPPPEQVHNLIASLAVKIDEFSNTLSERKGKVPPEVFEKEVVQFAAFVMQNFSRLHPMADGNGRTSRALYDLTISRFLGPESKYRELPMERRADGEITVSAAIDDALYGRTAEIFPDRTSAEANAAKLADIFAHTRYEDMLRDPDLQSFKTQIEHFVKERASQVLAEGATETTTESTNATPPSRISPEMLNSGFSDTPPTGLPRDSAGWITEDGRIFYNSKALNPLLAEGYSLESSPRGAVIKSPRGETLTLGQYRDALKNTEHAAKFLPLLRRMTEIKNHESMHRVTTLVDNPSQFFAELNGSEPLPQGKIRLTDQNGQPLPITPKNVDEFISRVADGTQPIDPAQRATLEQAIAAHLAKRGIPNFTFARTRTVDTRLLATNPREAFHRAEAAAKQEVTPPPGFTKITSATQFNQLMKEGNSTNPQLSFARGILTDMIGILHSGDAVALENFKKSHEEVIDRRILERLQNEIPQAEQVLTNALLSHKARQALKQAYDNGRMSPVTRELYETFLKHEKTITQALSNNDAQNRPKTTEQKQQDLLMLRVQLQFGNIPLNRFTAERIFKHTGGVELIAGLPGGMEIIRTSLQSENGLRIAQIPESVRAKMRQEAYPIITRRITEGIQSMEKKVKSLQRELRGSPGDPQLAKKLEHAFELLRTFQSMDLSNQASIEAQIKRMETQRPPKGYESVASIGDIFYANMDRLSPDILVRLMKGKVKYDFLETPNGNVPTMYLYGRNLGLGGLGEVWSTYVVEAGSPTPVMKEMVIKRPLVEFNVRQNIDGYSSLTALQKASLERIFLEFKTKGYATPAGFQKAYHEANSVLGYSPNFHQFNELMGRYRAAQKEAQNSRVLMNYQKNGQLTGFIHIDGVTRSGEILMESVANPKANHAVCDFLSIFAGEVTTLDGRTPITPEKVWDGFADVLDQLGDAHALGLLHRDIKPENIGFGPDGKIRILDLGSIEDPTSYNEVEFTSLNKAQVQGMLSPGENVNDVYEPGLSHYHFPVTGGITPGFYQGGLGYINEAKGTPSPVDGQPAYSWGYSDRVAMAVTLEQILAVETNPGYTGQRWIPPHKIASFTALAKSLRNPRADAKTAGRELRQIMAAP